MTQASKTELLKLHRQASETEMTIRELQQQALEKKQALHSKVERANAMLHTLIEQELRARRAVWCTICGTLVEHSVGTLLLIEQCRKAVENPRIYQHSTDLHAACNGCREKAFDQHGMVGDYDVNANSQEKYLAFLVDERKEGLFARKFGVWVELPAETFKRPAIPMKVLDDLTRMFDLPPFCDIKEVGGKECVQIMFHSSVREPVTLIVAPEDAIAT